MSLIKNILENNIEEAQSELEAAIEDKVSKIMGKTRDFIAGSFLTGNVIVGIGKLNGGINIDSGAK